MGGGEGWGIEVSMGRRRRRRRAGVSQLWYRMSSGTPGRGGDVGRSVEKAIFLPKMPTVQGWEGDEE